MKKLIVRVPDDRVAFAKELINALACVPTNCASPPTLFSHCTIKKLTESNFSKLSPAHYSALNKFHQLF